jgi:glycosyltransferase involved in cell wall biosynthesis
MTTPEHVAIVVPARDEEELIARSLASIARATRTCRRRLGSRSPTFATIVVADGCTDHTADIARGYGLHVIETTQIGVGAARALGVTVALSQSEAAPDRVWLANTDADSAVHSRWIVEQVERASAGADVYLGDVRPDFDDLSVRQREAWLASHLPGHARGHVHGASLGIRASAYLEIGGFEAIGLGEDVELVAAARKAGFVVALSATEILTSGRQVARANGGYSHYLANSL